MYSFVFSQSFAVLRVFQHECQVLIATNRDVVIKLHLIAFVGYVGVNAFYLYQLTIVVKQVIAWPNLRG